MATLATILAKIRQNVIDLPSDTEARLESWVQEAQLEAEGKHRWLGTRVLGYQATTTSNTLVAKPSTWLSPYGDPWFVTGKGTKVGMEWYPTVEDATNENTIGTATTDRGKPKGLLETASSIAVYPVPDQKNTTGQYSAAGEYLVFFPYHARAATLATGGTTSNFFTTNLDLALFLEDYASGQAMLFNRDYDNANAYLLKAAGHLMRAKRHDKLRAAQSLKITPRRDVYANRRQGRAR